MCFFCCCCLIPCGGSDSKIECELFRSNLKIFHLLYIVVSLFLFIFLISTMSIISWSKFPSINLTLFIILFLILVACMIFSIIIIFWKSDEIRQIEWREKIGLFSKICFCLSITSIILIFIEIIFISVAFSKAKIYYPCYGNGHYEVHVKVYVGFFAFKQNNNNFTSLNSTKISDLAKYKDNNRILSYYYD